MSVEALPGADGLALMRRTRRLMDQAIEDVRRIAGVDLYQPPTRELSTAEMLQLQQRLAVRQAARRIATATRTSAGRT